MVKVNLFSKLSFGGGGRDRDRDRDRGTRYAGGKSPVSRCQTCGAPHGGVYSPTTCHNCLAKNA